MGLAISKITYSLELRIHRLVQTTGNIDKANSIISNMKVKAKEIMITVVTPIDIIGKVINTTITITFN